MNASFHIFRTAIHNVRDAVKQAGLRLTPVSEQIVPIPRRALSFAAVNFDIRDRCANERFREYSPQYANLAKKVEHVLDPMMETKHPDLKYDIFICQDDILRVMLKPNTD